jgi:hypothetical protein
MPHGLWLALAALVAAALLAGPLTLLRRPASVETRSVAPTPIPTAPRAELTLRPPTPRAELVRLPAPRAELVRASGARRAELISLPGWHVGNSKLMLLPDGMEVRGTLRGALCDASQLPASGNQIGDTWLVGTTTWLWLTVPGTAAPQWVDP